MLQRKTFWCFYIWACFLGFIGMVIISQAALIVGSVSAQLTGADLTTIVGLVSIFNGIGRVLFGGIFYKLGTKKIMRIVCGLFFLSGMIIMIAILNSNIVILTASFITAGLSYGGVMSTSSAFINAYYGRINYAANYSVMNTSLIIASFGGTLAGWLHDLSGSYFSLTGLLLSIAATSLIFTFGVKDP